MDFKALRRVSRNLRGVQRKSMEVLMGFTEGFQRVSKSSSGFGGGGGSNHIRKTARDI